MMIIFLLIFLTNNCTNKEPEKPSLDLQDIRRVRLQTEDKDVLLPSSFQDTGDKIFISDFALGRQAFCFDPEGRLLMEIGRTGQGPGEFAFAGGIFYSDGVIRLGAGNKVQNLYDQDGLFLRTIPVPNLKEPAVFCTGPRPGEVYGTSFSRYVGDTIYHLDRDGEILKQFSPPDKAYTRVFDNFFPYGGLFKRGGQLVQFFNHRYELIFWSAEGIEQKRVELKSTKYVPPDYTQTIRGIKNEKIFRKSFTLFASAFLWEAGFVTVLRFFDDDQKEASLLEFWSHEFKFLGRVRNPDEEELVGVTEDGLLIFFKVDADYSSLIYRKPRLIAEGLVQIVAQAVGDK